MERMIIFLALVLVCVGLPLPGFSADNPADAPALRAAIFIQNRAGAEFTGKLDVLNDLLTTRLSEKGFSVIDRAVVLARFREAREVEAPLRRDIARLEKAGEESNTGELESALSAASALRIAQMTGADYLVIASLTAFDHETRTFIGENTPFGSNNRSDIYTLRIAVKVLEGTQGDTVYGDTVTVAERVALVENLKIESRDVVNKLLDSAALKIAENIGGKSQKIRDSKSPAAVPVPFSIQANVDGATVELDGAVIGSTPGSFTAAPGLHQLRISRQWLAPWDKTVNIFANQTLNITLELSAEGAKRYSTLEQLKLDLAKTKMQTEMEGKERETNIEIRKQQSSADGENIKPEENNDQPVITPSTVIQK